MTCDLFVQIYRVGVVKDLLVSFKHCSSWLMTSDPSRADASLIAYSPWMRLESGDPRVPFLERYQHAVLAHVITHPGITMVRQRSVHVLPKCGTGLIREVACLNRCSTVCVCL